MDIFAQPSKQHIMKLLTVVATLCIVACDNTQAPTDNTSSPTAAESSTSHDNKTPDSSPSPIAKTFTEECNTAYKTAQDKVSKLENYAGDYAADIVLTEVNNLDIVLDKAASKASLYRNVHPDPSVRTAADACQQQFAKLFTEISLSKALYKQFSKIDSSKADSITQRYVEHILRDFKRNGVNKDDATRNRIKALKEELTKLSQDFNRNIREDVRTLEIDSAAKLAGLPQDFIDSHKPGADGKIVITTDYPDYFPVMQYAHDDQLRLALYKTFRNRGYPKNNAILKELIQKRHELANILGYENYASYVTEDKMIQSAENAKNFIEKINNIAKPRAEQDYAVLLKRLQKTSPDAKQVGDWQKTYIEELIKQEKYQIDSKAVRQYFLYDQVRQGIFDLVSTLFNVEIKPWQTDVWHDSVKAYEIYDNGQILGRFYLDMHPREGKYKHAAHFGIQEGVKDLQLPISALICNFPGGDGSPGFMEHSQVETFLHEFGHLLHSMFGGHQPWLGISGINTEWDFVEAPSQMLEEWVWDAATLKSFARNTEGEVIPDSIIDKMKAARHFGRGLWIRHQMFYASISLNYYNQDPENFDLVKLMAELQNEYSPYSYVDDTHFYASFGHLDGYSAIYYTYMWSLVIAADMFSEFEKNGLRNTKLANHYRRTILEPGGSKDAAELVNDFLGRPYSFDAFAKELNKQ